MRRSPIRARVTALAALAVLLAALVGSLLFLQVLRHSLQSDLVATDRQDTADVTAELARGASPGQVSVTSGGDAVVQLVGRRGRVVAGQGSGGTALLTSVGTRYDVRVPGRHDRFTVVARRVEQGGPVQLVVAGRSTEQVQRAITTSLWLLAVAVPLAVALVALTIWLSVGRALQPVEAMRQEAAEITAAHLDRRVPVPAGEDEIARLSATINSMLDRIAASHQLQRQFVSDASHELRSPLAAIRQSVEVAQSYPDQVSMAALTEDVLAESIRLEGLVNALLLLARLDDRAATVDAEPVDLDDLVLAEAERLRTVARVKLDVSHTSAGQVEGSPVLLRLVVRNLLDNAVRHADTVVSVAVHEADDEVTMTVDDDGCGVPASERERVFERFVRLDAARAREAGGSGLGLAIVRDVVETSGGTVDIDESPWGGARLVVRLPTAS